MQLSEENLSKEVLDNIPARYKKTNEVDDAILKILGNEYYLDAVVHYLNLYRVLCATMSPQVPKWQAMQARVRKLIGKGVLERCSKVTFKLPKKQDV